MWRRGQVIVRREVWHGRPWSGIPVIVLDDTPDLLAVYLPERAPLAFPAGDWASWTPDPDWPRPALPNGWEQLS